MCLGLCHKSLSPGVAPEQDASIPADVQGGRLGPFPSHLWRGAPSLAKALCGPLCGCLMDQPQVFLQQLISFNTNQSVFIPKRLIFSKKKKKKTLVRKEWMKKEENNQGSEKKKKQSTEVKRRNTLVHTHKRKWEDCAKLESSWLSTEGRYCSSLSNCCHGKCRSSVARSWSLSRKVRNLHSYMTSPNF